MAIYDCRAEQDRDMTPLLETGVEVSQGVDPQELCGK